MRGWKPDDVARRVAYEGGIWNALDWGLTEHDIDPAQVELREALTALRAVFEAAWPLAQAVMALLPAVDPDNVPVPRTDPLWVEKQG